MNNTQLICTTKPFCTCANGPNVWDECCCFTGVDGLCVSCGAQMVLIDFQAGEPVVITTPAPNDIVEVDINTGEPITR